MLKNVASQSVGCQMIDASDGSAFTGSVTIYVTGDNGTQTTGSVASGACTNEGNGYYSYAPAQAETNYDHIAFTFTGIGAIPATVQVYTLPSTGFSTHSAADVWAAGTRTLTAGTNIALAKGTGVTGFTDLSASDVRTAVGLASANLDTQLGDLPTATENADALLKRDMSAVTGESARSPLNAFRMIRNKVSTSGTTLTVTKEDDTTAAWTAEVTTDDTADPITAIDPA